MIKDTTIILVVIGNSMFSCLLIVSYEFNQVSKDNQSIVDSKSIIILYNTSYNLPLGEFSENGIRLLEGYC